MKIIISSSPAPFQLAFLLTGSVEHDEGCWMLLQEAVKGLIGQVEDRGICLWPRHLRGLWLGGLRAETGRGNIGEEHFKKQTHCSWCAICTEQKSNTAAVHIPPDMSDTHIHTHIWIEAASPCWRSTVLQCQERVDTDINKCTLLAKRNLGFFRWHLCLLFYNITCRSVLGCL